MKRKRATPKASPAGVFALVAVVLAGTALLVRWAPWEQRHRTEVAASNPPPAAVMASNLSLNLPPPDAPVIDTNDPAVLTNLGNEALGEGDLPRAIEFYRSALKLKPDDEEHHFNLAFALARSGGTDEAIRHYGEALRLFPDYTEAHNNLGNLLVLQRRFTNALGHFAEAVRLSPDNSSYYNNRGRCLALLGRPAEAIPDFQQALKLHTNYFEARFNLGSAHLVTSNYDAAIGEFSRVLEAMTNYQPALAGLEKARERKAASQPKPAP